ncbi:imidazole glycerol phosphate synthase subunit HisH [Chryseobacterium sp. 6424]|uniref:imidazole glycerol phosphate synthase subunit HisH n=1 Tax=Chryseobacterium sp. 6424 TaxID=2039166 RepID=UPI000EFD675A|nr:imidazole glycerol phosphate synthase subunit HisH [Chryseobacterium sp. 6424]AYO57641.1 imidazole glycerol phosphate synthase subunit HisH [Chryseobacterium sp. 6424]
MIAIIDYAAGNVKSVENAAKKLGFKTQVTADHQIIRNADKVIFPGVGEASSAMEKLQAAGLDTLIPQLKQPFLGICLGQQLLCASSEEGQTKGLGIFDVEVKKFPAIQVVPHMGWNSLQQLEGPLFQGISETDDFYFVHSYYCELSEEKSSVCDYIMPFSASLHKNNFYGTQFHPEKSGRAGLLVLQNFLNLKR